MYIRIIDVPDGEAPLEVRRAWVGLVLRVATTETGPRYIPNYGVCTGPRTYLGHLWRVITGRAPSTRLVYVVRCESAFGSLSEVSPTALKWWRENTPDLFTENAILGFPAETSEQIPDPVET